MVRGEKGFSDLGRAAQIGVGLSGLELKGWALVPKEIAFVVSTQYVLPVPTATYLVALEAAGEEKVSKEFVVG